MENIAQALENAVDNILDEPITDKRIHDRTHRMMKVKKILKDYGDKKIQLPLCQRLFVWGKDKQEALFDTVQSNLSCGSIIFAENDGVWYLLDGLQRITSLMLMTNNTKYTAEERETISNYEVCVEVIDNMPVEEMSRYFNLLNSGILVAAAVKERNKLSAELNDAILKISNHKFFKEANTTIVFKKSHHHEIIAENILLAVSDSGICGNKAKLLCNQLQKEEDVILQNVDSALEMVGTLDEIYAWGIDTIVAKRSMNANFLSTLVYAMWANPHFEAEHARATIIKIFGAKQAIKEYSATTKSNAADVSQCQNRYDLVVNIMQGYYNEGTVTEATIDDFAEFCATSNNKPIHTRWLDEDYMVDFNDFTEAEKRQLFVADQNKDNDTWDELLENKYNQLLEDEENVRLFEAVNKPSVLDDIDLEEVDLDDFEVEPLPDTGVGLDY